MDLQTVADMAQTIGQEQVRQAMTTLRPCRPRFTTP